MALTKGLLDVLNNKDEPLSKRLRLVKDVFNYADFQISNKAGVLMNWLTNIGLKLDSSDIWETLKECLTSPYMSKLKQNEIRQDVLSNIIKAVSKRLEQEELDPNLKSEIFQCVIALLTKEIFQQYFKYTPKTFCMFVALVLKTSNSPNIVYIVLEQLFTFITRMPLTEDFKKYFLKYTFKPIVENLAKYDNKELLDISMKLVQRVTFSSNLLAFEEYLKNTGNSQKVENQLENSVINLLIKFYDKDNKEAKIAFQLIFTSFCFAYKNQQLLIYKFFICLLKIIGFNIERKFTVNIPESETTWNIERSLLILSEIIHVINIINLPIDLEINNVTISNCIEHILSSIISFSLQPDEYILRIIKLVISFDPLIIDNLLAEILSYVMLGKKNEEAVHIYSNLIMSIFDMYIKLHRFDILISEMLKSLKTNLENIKKEKSIFPFKHKCKKSLTFIESLGEIFPQSVIIHFHQCIILLPNKQILAIMKTLLKNLDEFVTNLKDFQNDFKELFFLQIVSEVTTQFLSAIKIVEHTTSETTVKEFIKYMHNLKNILSTLGTSLLQMEHNHVLMCCFLNIAYTWAELIILFLYYKPIDDINEKHTPGSDCAASNITYIHNYLTPEHWSILSQRIINFGEQPCKQILQKLIIQKVRAIILFEASIEPDVERATIKSFTSDLENNWSLILSEVFILRTIISKLEHQHVLEIASYIIGEAKKGKLDMLKNTAIYESKKLTLALLYVCISEMNALFKTKRKANAVKSLKFVSTKVFKQINYKNFIDAEDLNLDSICAMCKDNKIDEQIFEIDKKIFSQLCDIVKILPVLHLSTEIQTTFFVYILSVCLDLKTGGKQNKKCFEFCEDFLIGMLNVRSLINLGLLFPVVDLFEMLLNNLTRYNEIIPAILYRVLDEEKSANSFEEVVSLLVKNLPEKKYLDLAILTLTTINRIRSITLKKEHRNNLQKYKTKLCKYLTKKVLMDTTIQDEKVEPFALVLQKYLAKDKKGRLSALSKQVEDCLKQCAKGVNPKNAKGCILLVYLLLTNRKQFKPVTKLLNSYSWKICRNQLFFGKENYFGYSQAVTILVKHSTYKMFCKILNDVSDLTMKFLKSGQTLQLNNINKLWSLFFITVSDKSKQEAVYLSLSTLLLAGMVYLTDNQDMVFTEAFTSFQAQLVPIKQFSHNPNVLDIYFQTVFVIMSREYGLETLPKVIQLCYKIMDLLMKHADVLIVDRIPTYFILVRLFFNQICNKSNTELNLNEVQLKTMENCAFLLEKLLRDIRSLKKDVSRVTRYLIADIIHYFEKISLYPTVKLHITNGLYEIIDLCDGCSLSYLLANMSVASAEIFKGIHENYKKYYKYTGKV